MATLKKAQPGPKTPAKKPTPTYKNLPMGVKNQNYQMTGESRDIKPSSSDSARYRGGFEQGLKGSKGSIGEGTIEKMGRWEGQNVGKKKAKTGAKISKGKKVAVKGMKSKAMMTKSASPMMKKGGKMSKKK